MKLAGQSIDSFGNGDLVLICPRVSCNELIVTYAFLGRRKWHRASTVAAALFEHAEELLVRPHDVVMANFFSAARRYSPGQQNPG